MPEIIDRRISFNAGEISPWLDPRLDLDKYRMGCRTLQNMRPSIYGGAFGRSGTRYLGNAATADSAVRLIPFTREITTSYLLEFTELKFRVWDAATQTLVASVANGAWVTATDYAPGYVASHEGANYEVIETHTSGTFATDLEDGKLRLYPVQEVATPYTAAQLDALQFAQQNDVLFLTHPEHFPQVLSLQSDGWWRMTEVNIDWPVTLGPNLGLTTITPLIEIYQSITAANWLVGTATYQHGQVVTNPTDGKIYFAQVTTGTAGAITGKQPDLYPEYWALSPPAWDSANAYETGDWCQTGGKWYQAVQTTGNTNKNPTDSPPKSFLTAPPAWTTSPYTVGSYVTYLGIVYECILASTNNVPPNATYWKPAFWNPMPKSWNAGSYAANTRCEHNGIHYLSAVDANSTTPGTTTAQGKWIEGRLINATTTSTAPIFVATTYYTVGDLVTYNGLTYVRTAYYSGGAVTIPPTGYAQSYLIWNLAATPVPDAVLGAVPKGKSVTLKASAATWNANHVDTKWLVGHRRDNLKVSFLPSAQAVGYVTDPLYVLGEWTAQVTQPSAPTAAYEVSVIIERSTDLLTWEPHYSVNSTLASVQQLLTGTEEIPLFLRMRLFSKSTTGVPTQLGYELVAGNPLQQGIVRILTYTSSTEVVALVEVPLYRYLPTTVWEEPAWTADFGFPRAVTLHENRLFFGGNKRKPTTIWGSAIDVYQDFRLAAQDDRAVSYTLASDESSAIEWLVSQDMLVIGTSSGEWVMGMRPGDDAPKLRRNTSFGSASIQARAIADALVFVQRSRRKMREFAWSFERDGYQANDLIMLSEHLGDAEFRAIAIQRNPESVVWVATTRGDLLSLTYERGQNVAGWARHVTYGRIESVAVVPGDGEDDHVWIATKRIVGLDFINSGYIYENRIERIEPDQFRAIKNGDLKTLIYLDCAIIKTPVPNITITHENSVFDMPLIEYDAYGWPVWELVDGGTTYRLEFIQKEAPVPPSFITAQERWRFTRTTGATLIVAESLIYVPNNPGVILPPGTPVDWPGNIWPHQTIWTEPNGFINPYLDFKLEASTIVTGLEHLDYSEVGILADGMPHRRLFVSSGQITLDRVAETVVVGYPYDMILEPTWFETMDPQSISKQGRKRLMKVAMQFWETLGCQTSVDGGESWEPVAFNDTNIPAGNALPLFTGQKEIVVNSGTAREVSVILKQSQPLPFNLMSLGSRYTVEI